MLSAGIRPFANQVDKEAVWAVWSISAIVSLRLPASWIWAKAGVSPCCVAD
ncbi:hypothetical protein RSSM_01494 [Rhodopirellula sallentina SM41]|uniref:Uncharacterized protein n=1 Tax=Rhodopirellula sallentina SM41 TaxID=1263870 RepID=M5U717_9BACT|nr:hypothetical protein RSSM_01494 [Rhodopirellula sallentina SM41]